MESLGTLIALLVFGSPVVALLATVLVCFWVTRWRKRMMSEPEQDTESLPR
ncbi:hypothetical protein NX801_08505 [Streptomyces sp. LP05-1]|uniref:Uncharacterized protein n=1 Tax=Streptomyces pyxinae TaxID=2970734 RepID=A0ABT2CGH5_9ACTN|nr:hypothetical protein [Streptomyces sp. LP05-1]MCS0635704.1 hypothetical protein [Streptomyces sp. LP05-1]